MISFWSRASQCIEDPENQVLMARGKSILDRRFSANGVRRKSSPAITIHISKKNKKKTDLA